MVDDGNGNFGGGGSVHWDVKVKDGDEPQIIREVGQPQRVYQVKGRDGNGTAGNYFLVVIPDTAEVKVGVEGAGVVLAVPIRDGRPQVNVKWAYTITDKEVKNLKPLNPTALA